MELDKLMCSHRFKPDMWAKVAEEMQVPWRAAEAMHWQLGEADMARRAGVTPFSLQPGGPEGKQPYHRTPEGKQPYHRTSPSDGHSPQYGGGPSHAAGSPHYGRTPVMMDISARLPPPGHGASVVPPPPHANVALPTLAARRDSIPRRHYQYQHHLRPPSPDDAYSVPGSTLPPIQPGAAVQGHGRAGALPGVVELTTGISPYSTPAYSLSLPTASPAASGTASPGPVPSGQSLPPLSSYYRQPSPLSRHQHQYQTQPRYAASQHYEAAAGGSVGTAAAKRRASPDVMARETSRRRHLEPQAGQQHYNEDDQSGSQRPR
jgi:hypothetical protein